VPHAPQHAVEEIERLGSHDQMVQVMLPGAHQSPYGDEQYWPIYEAAENAGLSLLLHTTAASSGVAWAPTTGAGIPLSYFEKHAIAVAPLMGQLTSMVFEGVFVEYSDLDMVFVEQRLGWIPDFMWHMDKLWKGLKDAAPWLERRPSEYIRDNVYFSTQPIAEPERPEISFNYWICYTPTRRSSTRAIIPTGTTTTPRRCSDTPNRRCDGVSSRRTPGTSTDCNSWEVQRIGR